MSVGYARPVVVKSRQASLAHSRLERHTNVSRLPRAAAAKVTLVVRLPCDSSVRFDS